MKFIKVLTALTISGRSGLGLFNAKKRLSLKVFLAALLILPFLAAAQDKSGPRDEILYNGIQLPEVWPPKTEDPRSIRPMAVPYLENRPDIIPIHIGRQLFVDDFLIEKTDLTRVYHTAQKYDGNPVFRASTEHEHNPTGDQDASQRSVTYLGHGGVFYDPEGGQFKMFYTAGWRGGLALATSHDLVNWQRPDLGLVGGNLMMPPGSLWAGGDNSLWLDLNAKSPLERHKFLTRRGGKIGHTVHTSADGRVWSQGVSTGKAGDYCSFFYNPFREKWVFSIKREERGRARYYSEADDFLKGADWKDAVYWVNADSLDEPDPEVGDAPQLYSLNAVAYESIMLGEFYIHLGPNNKICNKGKFPKITELKLGYSRDGFYWHRPDRRAFIGATREEGDWDRAYLHGTTGVCVVKGDEIWFPYCAYSGISPDGTRGMYTGGSIGMAILRRDGFASMEAGKKKGTLTTRPVVFKGKHLFVNVDCSDGSLRVEILDENNKVIAPFSLKNSMPVSANKTLYSLEWNGSEDLSSLVGKPVRFRFHLTNGKLYSFWVSPDKNGASHGYVGAGGPGFDGVIDTKGIDAY